MSVKFADRMQYMKASEIRELLKVTEQPEMISFAGGLPAPELFPVEALKDITVRVLAESGMQALQYATTEGYTPLREKIASRMNIKYQTRLSCDNILITSGSQQGLDLTGKVFLNEGDVVLCESPTYLGAINAFSAYRPRMLEVPTDDEGMLTDELEKILDSVENIRLIYAIPDFQNPSGRSWSLERRRRLMEIVGSRGIPVLEDAPYSELRFEGELLPPLKAFDTKGLVVYLGTFSKVFCPGMRIGWVAADGDILEKYILVKQGADLHSSGLVQRNISMYMDLYDLDEDIERLKEVYRSRRDVMLAAMKAEFPEGVRYTYPGGGLFTWVVLPERIDACELLEECLKNNVAFVPGGSFFPNGGGRNTMRLNFSNMPEDRIAEGIRRLGRMLRVRLDLN